MTDKEYPDDFSGFPKSVSELRAEKSENATDWSPRDAMISALRRMDELPEGEIVDTVVVAFRIRYPDGTVGTKFQNAAPNLTTSMGVIETVKFQLMEPFLQLVTKDQ